MTDARIRELERRWHETGSLDDEAAWLRERVRAGELPEERLRLAAQCGHAGALCAVPDAGPRFDVDPSGWQARMEERHPELLVWLAAAGAAEVAPRVSGRKEREHLAGALEAARAWLACPCVAHGAACQGPFLVERCHPLGRALSFALLWSGGSRQSVLRDRRLGEALALVLREAAALGGAEGASWLGRLRGALAGRGPGELLGSWVSRLATELLRAPAMPPPLSQPPSLEDLIGRSDFELCNAVYSRLGIYGQDHAPSSPAERVVMLVWLASGVIGNGGFEYLFAHDVEGDADYLHTYEALGEIGAVQARAAYAEALAWFPGSRPPLECERRRALLERVPEAEREPINVRYWGAGEEVRACLAAYIRAHQSELEAVLRARDAWRARRALRLP